MIAILINECLKVTVKDSGAELVSIKNTFSNKEYLWQGNPSYWGRRAPILFPIVGKVQGNKYLLDGKQYELPQHGFARDMHFDRVEEQNNSLTYILKSNAETLKVYPYLFELKVQYYLEKNKVIVRYEVKNTQEDNIYFSLGAHPAFNCPLEPGEVLSDYYIEFEKAETADAFQLQEGLISGGKIPVLKNDKILNLTTELFDNDALIFKGLRSGYVKLKSRKSDHVITVDFTGFPYLAFWTKKGGAPFICIEPWYGIADKAGNTTDFKEKEGVRSLVRGRTFSTEYFIQIDSPKR